VVKGRIDRAWNSFTPRSTPAFSYYIPVIDAVPEIPLYSPTL